MLLATVSTEETNVVPVGNDAPEITLTVIPGMTPVKESTFVTTGLPEVKLPAKGAVAVAANSKALSSMVIVCTFRVVVVPLTIKLPSSVRLPPTPKLFGIVTSYVLLPVIHVP